MSITIQFKQGTTAENQAFVGAAGELTVDMEQQQLRLHNGVTPGGTIIGPYDAPLPQGSTAFAPYITNYSTGETMPLQPAFIATAYMGQGTHVDSRWLIAEDADFSTLAYDSDWTTDALTALDTATIPLTLTDSTEYHIAVTYRNNDGIESPRSTALVLTALAPRPETPTITSPAHEDTSSSLTPIITASAYIGSIAHGESHWILATDASLTTIVHDTGWTSTYLEAFDLDALSVELVKDLTYYIAVSYRTVDGYASLQSPVVSFIAGETTPPSLEDAKLLASDLIANDYFGASVAISENGSTAVIGAYQADDAGTSSGCAYVFTHNGTSWGEQGKLVASDASEADIFGFSVGVSNDGSIAVIGAPYDDDAGSYSGSAYVFVRDGSSWSEQAKLVASDAASEDYFGMDVAVSGDGSTVVVGATGDDDKGSNSGCAYVFTYNGSSWSEQAKLVASDAAGDDRFGFSVGVSGDGSTAVIGAYLDDDAVTDSGSAYIFTYNGSSWSEQAKLVASDASSDTRFGWDVAVSGDGSTAIIGAHYDDAAGSRSGSAYIFA